MENWNFWTSKSAFPELLILDDAVDFTFYKMPLIQKVMGTLGNIGTIVIGIIAFIVIVAIVVFLVTLPPFL